MFDKHTTPSSRVPRRTEYTPRSAQEAFIVPLLRARIIRALDVHLTTRGTRVLDVGCGEQPLRADVERYGSTYTSVDVHQNAAGTVHFVAAIDSVLPPELRANGPFDFIVCTEVMEHVADWAMAFENFTSLMAPGSKLLITCPHVFPLHEEPYDFWRATPYALKFHGLRAGLEIVEQEKLGTGWDVLGTILGALPTTPASPTLTSRVAAKVAGLARKVLFVAVRSGMLRKLVAVSPGVYLSNFVVFARPK